MSDSALNILTIVVLVPLFAVASIGGFFLIAARQDWKGAIASFFSFSTAVAIPLFAFRWRSGEPFLDALVFSAWISPLIVAGTLLALAIRGGLYSLETWPSRAIAREHEKDKARLKPHATDFDRNEP